MQKACVKMDGFKNGKYHQKMAKIETLSLVFKAK